jgi:hypothetical protein
MDDADVGIRNVIIREGPRDAGTLLPDDDGVLVDVSIVGRRFDELEFQSRTKHSDKNSIMVMVMMVVVVTSSTVTNESRAVVKCRILDHMCSTCRSLSYHIHLSVVFQIDIPVAPVVEQTMVESDLILHVVLVFEQQRGPANWRCRHHLVEALCIVQVGHSISGNRRGAR